MSKDQIEILGVKINTMSFDESKNFIIKRILEENKTFVTTPNPEIVLETLKDNNYKEILNKSTLNIPDGNGLKYMSKYLFFRKKIDKKIKEAVHGSDMMMALCTDKRLNGKKIFLLGASDEVAIKTKKTLEKINPNINIVGTFSGKADEEDDKISREKINYSNAEIVFVAFGAPKQEKWIARNKDHLEKVLLFIGIGGTFDFISGHKKRAPKLIRKLNLEWLYRVIIEPRRIKRILKAVLIFPIIVLKKDLFSK